MPVNLMVEVVRKLLSSIVVTTDIVRARVSQLKATARESGCTCAKGCESGTTRRDASNGDSNSENIQS